MMQAMAPYPVSAGGARRRERPVLIKRLPGPRRADAADPLCAVGRRGAGGRRRHALRAARHPRRGGHDARQPLRRRAGLHGPRPRMSSACWCRSRPPWPCERIEEIAAVDGVDGLFIGPTDLAASMGFPGQMRHPEVVAAIEDAVRRIVATGKAAGILTFDPAFARTCMSWGTRFTAVGMDLALMVNAARRWRPSSAPPDRRAWGAAGCLRRGYFCQDERARRDDGPVSLASRGAIVRRGWHGARTGGSPRRHLCRPPRRSGPRLGSRRRGRGAPLPHRRPDLGPPAPGPVPVFETLTSGSTGTPRRIRRTHASWIASFAVNARLFGIGPGRIVAVPGAPWPVAVALWRARGDAPGREAAPAGRSAPGPAWRLRWRTGGAHLLYATPAQLAADPRRPPRPPPPELRLIVCGGAKLDPATRTALAARFPQAEVREFYGAAEASFITLADALTPPQLGRRAYPGVEIDLRGPRAPAGLGPLALSVRNLRRRLRPLRAGRTAGCPWARSADWDGTHLFLSGRADRMVTVADQNVFPEEIEAFLLSLPGVTRAAVLPRPDPSRPCDRGGRAGRRRGDDPRRRPAGPRPPGGAEAAAPDRRLAAAALGQDRPRGACRRLG